MRVGVISDTHLSQSGDPGKLERIARRHFQDIRTVLHAGDLTSLHVVERALGDFELIAVAGNMDDVPTSQVLPLKRVVGLGGFRVGLIHGWGEASGVADRVAAEFDDVDCIVYGHTHVPECRMRRDVLFFNPGSPFDQRFAPHRSIGILEFADQPAGKLIAVGD